MGTFFGGIVCLILLIGLGKWICHMFAPPSDPLVHSQYPELVQDVPAKQPLILNLNLPTFRRITTLPPEPVQVSLPQEATIPFRPAPAPVFQQEPEPEQRTKMVSVLNQTGTGIDLKRMETNNPREYLLIVRGMLWQIGEYHNEHGKQISRTKLVPALLGRTEWDYLVGPAVPGYEIAPGILRTIGIVKDVSDEHGRTITTMPIESYEDGWYLFCEWYRKSHPTAAAEVENLLAAVQNQEDLDEDEDKDEDNEDDE